jgi:hypothetical protein
LGSGTSQSPCPMKYNGLFVDEITVIYLER